LDDCAFQNSITNDIINVKLFLSNQVDFFLVLSPLMSLTQKPFFPRFLETAMGFAMGKSVGDKSTGKVSVQKEAGKFFSLSCLYLEWYLNHQGIRVRPAWHGVSKGVVSRPRPSTLQAATILVGGHPPCRRPPSLQAATLPAGGYPPREQPPSLQAANLPPQAAIPETAERPFQGWLLAGRRVNRALAIL
jgi:hypothetical protein